MLTLFCFVSFCFLCCVRGMFACCISPEGDSSLTPPRPPPPTSGAMTAVPLQSPQSTPLAPAAVHRWPLRPGVQVHVNGARSLGRDNSPPSPPSSADFIRTSTPQRPSQYSEVVGTVPGGRQSRKRPVQVLRREQASSLVGSVARGSATVFPSNSSTMPRVNCEEPGGNITLINLPPLHCIKTIFANSVNGNYRLASFRKRH